MNSNTLVILTGIFCILVLIGCFWTLLEMFDEANTNDKCLNFTFSVAIIAAILFILCIVTSWKFEKQTWECDNSPYKTQEIVGLGDSNEVNGRVYARRGYINEDLYYHYIVERPSGGFVAGKVKANDAVLYYTDEDFRIEWYKIRREWLIFYQERENYAKIYIPEGSITDDFKVDLE